MEQNFKTYMDLQEENKELKKLLKLLHDSLNAVDALGGITSCKICVYNSGDRCNSGKKICAFKYIYSDNIKLVLGDEE